MVCGALGAAAGTGTFKFRVITAAVGRLFSPVADSSVSPSAASYLSVIVTITELVVEFA
jgi:hypothetical protein